jgi:iron complex transport system substrate-binding protein
MFATVRCRRLILTAVALLSAIAHLGATDAPGKPRRIVSLNMCVDELVLRLAEPQNIASVTWLSRDPKNSNVAELGARIPVNHGLAEESIPLNPDLIIAGIYTARTAVAMLKRVGIPVLEIGVPKSLDDVRAQIREIAGLIGEGERGEASWLTWIGASRRCRTRRRRTDRAPWYSIRTARPSGRERWSTRS